MFPETRRLLLRQWQQGDLDSFAQLSADVDVMRYLPGVLNREQSDALGARIQSLITERGWGFWAVEIKELHAFAGFVGLHIPTADLPFNPCVEIGWRLAKPFWGNGYATEAAHAAAHFAFTTLALTEIVAFTTVANYPSQRVMERLGMQRDPETFLHPELPADSPLSEHCLYRLSADSWSKQHA